MLASLVVAFAALRAGMRLRQARLGRARRDPAQRARHLRLARPAVWLVLLGFAGGPVSMLWLRGERPFGTAHAVAGCLAAALFVAAAVLGRRLESGRGRPVGAHALLGVLAMLAAALAAVAGFVLLP